jgi:hypothetical protein
MIVNDLPIAAILHIGEAIAGGDRFGFTVFRVGERVVASVDRGVTVDADQLIAELDGCPWQRVSRIAQAAIVYIGHAYTDGSTSKTIGARPKWSGSCAAAELASFRKKGGLPLLESAR